MLKDNLYCITVTYVSGRKDVTVLKNENHDELEAELRNLEYALCNNPTVEEYTVC